MKKARPPLPDGGPFPLLPKSYKGRFPFRMGTTSFIYPATWSVNARLLAPFMDEIELLLFESQRPNCLPSDREIQTLKQLKHEWAVQYNVHLPVDVSLAATHMNDRHEAIRRIQRVIALAHPLDPVSYTLHILPPPDNQNPGVVRTWKETVYDSLQRLIKGLDRKTTLAIENLYYPLAWLQEIITSLDLAVCLDVGHLVVHGGCPETFCQRFGKKIALMHLHGAHGGKDHLPLTRLPYHVLKQILHFLETFTGTVSMEVFNFEALSTSLDFFAHRWAKRI